MALIFDIETIGADFDKLDETTQHSLTRWIKREAGDDQGKYNVMLQDLKEGLGFSPLTGEIVALGILDDERNKGVVYYQSLEQKAEEFSQDNFIFKPRTEAEILKDFWQGAKQYNEFVSFNGRSFDVPFMLIRSAVHKIKPTKDLMSNRYLRSQYFNAKHIDLLDQLSFYGAVRRKGNLHLYCNVFGIKSPKAEGIAGDDVGRLFKERKYKEIAEYNSWDLTATCELYKRWRDYIKI
ncbi:MAG: ribonuclease H-like domain-containing protein [Patescibacteria group bacterium]|nr:ribonuclease H-like domain-containing protein [Patescibacteria group bacterium]